jgi:DNA repair protein SbcC/Rad50
MRNIVFKRILLNNFRMHEIMDFDFSENKLITIVGSNGAGKTTVFDALLWCLIDETTKGIKADKVVRKRSGKNTMVALGWECDNINYLVVNFRKHKKFKNEKFLFRNVEYPFMDVAETIDEQMIENDKIMKELLDSDKNISGETKAETNKKIEDLLMKTDILKNCLLFSQFTKKNFIEMSPSEQRDILDKMLLLDSYDEYYDNVSTLHKEKTKELEKIENELEIKISSFSNIEDKKDSANNYYINKKNELINEKEQLNIEIKDLNKKIKSKKDEIKNIKEIKDKYQEYVKNQTKLEEKISNKRNECNNKIEIEKSKINSDLNQKIENINNKYNNNKNNLIEEKNKSEKDLLNIEKEKDNILSKARERELLKVQEIENKYKNVIESLINKKNEIENNELNLDMRNDEIKENLENYKDELENFNKDRNKENPVCYTCGQEISENNEDSLKKVDNKINDIKTKIKSLENEFKNNSNKITKNKKESKNIKTQLSEKSNELSKEKSELKNKVISFKNKTNEKYDKQIDELNNKIEELEIKIDKIKLEQENEIEKLKDEKQDCIKEKIDEIKEKYKKQARKDIQNNNNIKEEINNLSKKLEEYNEIEKDINKIQEKISISKTKVENIENNIIEEEKRLNNKLDELKEKEKEKKEIIKNSKKSLKNRKEGIKILEFWKKGFSDFGIKNLLLDEAIPILREKAFDLSKLTGNIRVEFDSQSTTAAGEYRNKFNVNAVHSGNLSELDEFSGGETRMVNIIVLLCLRNLLETMQGVKINVLLLDEILDSLDPENAMVAVEMIRKLSKNYCVVLISHTLRDYIESDELIQM